MDKIFGWLSRLVAGRRTKWITLAVWILLAGGAGVPIGQRHSGLNGLDAGGRSDG